MFISILDSCLLNKLDGVQTIVCLLGPIFSLQKCCKKEHTMNINQIWNYSKKSFMRKPLQAPPLEVKQFLQPTCLFMLMKLVRAIFFPE